MDNPITPKPPTTSSLSKITWLKPGLIGFLIGMVLMGTIWFIFKKSKKDKFKTPVTQQHINPEPQVKSILKKSVSWKEDFIPSSKFKGHKPKYVFKKGDKGQGYYKDG